MTKLTPPRLAGALLLFVCMTFFSFSSRAQIQNDSCVNAYSLDTIPLVGVLGGCYNGLSDYDTFFIFNSGFGSIGWETPYWAATGSCSGYTNATQPGWNDMWFRFVPEQVDRNIRVYFDALNDTVHLTLWSVINCDTMSAMCCSTFGDTTGEVFGEMQCLVLDPCRVGDEIYLQFSTPDDSLHLNGICLGLDDFGIPGPCCPVGLFCFGYQINAIGPTSATSANGSISVGIGWGQGPFMYLWDDGDTNQHRTGLDTGSYVVTITDGNGCQEVDTIDLTSLVGVERVVQNDLFYLYPNPSSGVVRLVSRHAHVWSALTVVDVAGRVVLKRESSFDSELLLELPEPGIYSVVLTDQHGQTATRKVVVE